MDPRNTAVRPSDIDWTEPSAAETGRFRKVIDLHSKSPREYLRMARGERIAVETDRFGCSITTDTTGEHPAITLECPE